MTTKREWKQCQNKARFPTEHDALKHGKPYGQRAYGCIYCNGWHLTKVPFDMATPSPVPPDTPEARVKRAHRALHELERKGVTGPLREAAERNLADEQKNLHDLKKGARR